MVLGSFRDGSDEHQGSGGSTADTKLVTFFQGQDHEIQKLLCAVARRAQVLQAEAIDAVWNENTQLRMALAKLGGSLDGSGGTGSTVTCFPLSSPSAAADREKVVALQPTYPDGAAIPPPLLEKSTTQVLAQVSASEPPPLQIPCAMPAEVLFSDDELDGSRSSGYLAHRQAAREQCIATMKSAKADPVTQQAKLRSSLARGEWSANKKKSRRSEPGGVFADADAMKEKVRQAIAATEYNVTDYYHKKGIFQEIARSALFEHLTLVVIGCNSIWIAVDTDLNNATTIAEADTPFVLVENVFCIYFLAELIIRFMAFRSKRDGLRDPWFVFDLSLVLMMIGETWCTAIFLELSGKSSGGFGDASVLKLLRLLRLTRMARMVRLLRAFPELMILLKGMAVAARSVLFTLCLLLLFIYVFAIAFRQLTLDTEIGEEYFSNMFHAGSTLLLKGILPDLAELVEALAKEHPAYAGLMLLFILLGSLTVMNMLVGVLVEVVSVVSTVEKEQLMVTWVRNKLVGMLQSSDLDTDGDQAISRAEFEQLLVKPEAAKTIQDVGVDVVGLVDFADFLFEEGTDLSFGKFMELILQLRGTNKATVRDIVDMRKYVMLELMKLESRLTDSMRGTLQTPRPLGCTPSLGKPTASTPGTGRPFLVKEPLALPAFPAHFFASEKRGNSMQSWSNFEQARQPSTKIYKPALGRHSGQDEPDWEEIIES